MTTNNKDKSIDVYENSVEQELIPIKSEINDEITQQEPQTLIDEYEGIIFKKEELDRRRKLYYEQR